MSVLGKGEVCRLERLGREPDVEFPTWAVEGEDLEPRLFAGRVDDLEVLSVVERRLGFEGCVEE